MKLPFASAISVLAWVGLAAGRRPGMLAPPLDAGDEFAIQAAGASSTTGSAFFTQILDHDNPSKGTFQQKFTPGEIAAAGYGAYLTNVTLTGLLAQELNGAVVMIEREKLVLRQEYYH
jgi:hypothetical protein